MRIMDISIRRDGGTIQFSITHHPLQGTYTVAPMWAVRTNDRDPFTKDGIPLTVADQRALLSGLEEWIVTHLTVEITQALRELELLVQWKNLPSYLEEVIPYHRIRSVIGRLRTNLVTETEKPESC